MLNVLCVGPQYPATAARYLFDAFGAVDGIHVTLCGPEYNDHYGIDWGTFKVVSDIPLPKEAPEWNIKDFVDTATSLGNAPDLVLIAEENYKTNIINTVDIPTVLLSYDGWPNAFDRYHMVKPTLAYTCHPYGVRPAPVDKTPVPWRFLPTACHPPVHHSMVKNHSDKYFAKRSHAFVLHATPYGKRPDLCKYLEENGIGVTAGLVNTTTYVVDYSYGLCTYHNCCYQEEIKYRFFEAAAMGCINITDVPNNPRIFNQLGLIAGIHYIPVAITETGDDPYPDFADILKAVKSVLNDKRMAKSISKAAHAWVMNGHTYFHRAKQILTDLGMHRYALKLHTEAEQYRVDENNG